MTLGTPKTVSKHLYRIIDRNQSGIDELDIIIRAVSWRWICPRKKGAEEIERKEK